MTAAIAFERDTVVVRDARDADNEALVALAAACPMAGDITMCVDRAPNFFALSKLEGSQCKVGVAVAGAGPSTSLGMTTAIIGCGMASERWSYVHGKETQTTYAGDLKVHPSYRGTPAADGLVAYIVDCCRQFGGDDVPSLLTVLAGNTSMQQRERGPRGLPALCPVASLDVFAIPFLWRRESHVRGVQVCEAKHNDIEEMAALWARIGPTRQFTPVLTAQAFGEWLENAPGLTIDDYLVARSADGRIAGFMALWDQCEFKQLRVLGYSRRLAAARFAVNAMAPLAGSTTLPATGAQLRSLSAVHVCAPMDDPAVLRALLLSGYSRYRATGRTFFTMAIDRQDPVRRALAGLFAQPTPVNAFVTTPAGRWTGGSLSERPLYFESALV